MLLGVENEQQKSHTQLPLGFPVPERQEWVTTNMTTWHPHLLACFTLWEFNSLLLKMAIELVDLPMKHADARANC